LPLFTNSGSTLRLAIHSPALAARASRVFKHALVQVILGGKEAVTGQGAGAVAESGEMKKQTIVTLDLEGVLVPEIWIAFAEKTGIDALRRTTRDEPDYDVLMAGRLKILDDHGLKLPDIQEVIGTLSPMEGAKAFLDELRSLTQVIILSDTFEEFAHPLMRQLGWPTIFCHHLEVDSEGRIVSYKLRQSNQKQHAVAAFKGLNYKVIAAGDSFNDTTMLGEADRGFFFHAPESIQVQFPQFKPFDRYEDLMGAIRSEL
jgi:phosphoserine/homoserine phosphotransferase